jgi:hypothetical protein
MRNHDRVRVAVAQIQQGALGFGGRLISLFCLLLIGLALAGCGNGSRIEVDNNANLASLSISRGALDQPFATNQLAYTTRQPFPVYSLQVTATPESGAATLKINGVAAVAGQASIVDLAGCEDLTIPVEVTAASGSVSRTYRITVSREGTVTASEFAQHAYIKASNPDGSGANATGAGDQFGYAMAMSGDGNTLAIGAPNESSNATGVDGVQDNNQAPESGAVYVFTRDGEHWVPQAYLKASNAGAFDQFGFSLSLSHDGNVLAVGAFAEGSASTGVDGDQDDDSARNAGAVYVFTRSGAAWSQQAYLKASNVRRDYDMYFGWSVSLSSDGATLAVGAPHEDGGSTGVDGDQDSQTANGSGAVYVFQQEGGTWSQKAYIKASNAESADLFGSSVSLSGEGNVLAVGARGEDGDPAAGGNQSDNSISNAGAVYVFARADASWEQRAYLKAAIAANHDAFGSSLALSADGHTLAVGAYSENGDSSGITTPSPAKFIGDSGAVYVFRRFGATWRQDAYIKASIPGVRDTFGWSVALSGDGCRLLVGARHEQSDANGFNGNEASNLSDKSGASYMYARSNGGWSRKAYIKASNTGVGDEFGISVALSADGGSFAIGAHGEQSGAGGINGDQSNDDHPQAGAVYAFATGGAPAQ